jgi:hypothetical protein
MVKKYLQSIEEVMDYPRHFHDEAKGIYSDGWTAKMLDITYSPEAHGRMLELIMEVPAWVPYKKAMVSLDTPSGKKQKWTIDRGNLCKIGLPLTETGGHLVFSIEPAFVPSKCNMGMDDRPLGVLCKGCHLISVGKERTILWPVKE